MDKLITTVWHTGTHSLMREFEEEKIKYICLHCDEVDIKNLNTYTEIHTTYRKPIEVLASWVARDHMREFPDWRIRWKKQWENYFLLKPLSVVHQMFELKHRENQNPRGDIYSFWAKNNDYDNFKKIIPDVYDLMLAAGVRV